MEETKVNTSVVIIILVIIFAAVGVVWLLNKNSIKAPESKIETRSIEKRTLAEGLPQDLPQEAGSKILKNETTTENGERLQSTRTYQSFKSVTENGKLFADYLKKSGWGNISEIPGDKSYTVFGVKEDSTINIDINKDNSAENASIVGISVSWQNKKPLK